jgi:hypothetical protein
VLTNSEMVMMPAHMAPLCAMVRARSKGPARPGPQYDSADDVRRDAASTFGVEHAQL